MTRLAVAALPVVLLLTGATIVLATDLRITDSRGTEVVVTAASVDYSGFLAADKETDGIRVLQGDGTVTVKWADIEKLTVTGNDDSVKPARTTVEIVLRNGKKVPAALLRQGQMRLVGKTDLGDYAIALDKIRTISPVR